MKIAALSPQFVIETPAGEETARAARTAESLGLKLIRTDASQASSNDESLDHETREGLKRLSRIIREKKKRTPELAQNRGLSVYRRLAGAADHRDVRGLYIDLVC